MRQSPISEGFNTEADEARALEAVKRRQAAMVLQT
jgi:hypothetical protein